MSEHDNLPVSPEAEVADAPAEAPAQTERLVFPEDTQPTDEELAQAGLGGEVSEEVEPVL